MSANTCTIMQFHRSWKPGKLWKLVLPLNFFFSLFSFWSWKNLHHQRRFRRLATTSEIRELKWIIHALMVESLILFIDELNLGKCRGKFIRNLREYQFRAVSTSELLGWPGKSEKMKCWIVHVPFFNPLSFYFFIQLSSWWTKLSWSLTARCAKAWRSEISSHRL